RAARPPAKPQTTLTPPRRARPREYPNRKTLQIRDNGPGELHRARAPALVGREHPALRIDLADGIFETPRFVREPEVLEHHRRRQHRRGRIDDSLAHDVRRSAVNGFEVRVAVSVASARREPESPDGS